MNKKEFRSKVLKVHYELAGGDMYHSVMRTDVAKELGIADYNDMELINAIMYLSQKGYLGNGSNITENLTVYGIDEYENGFPNLGKPYDHTKLNADILLELIKEIEEAEELAAQGLYKYDEETALLEKIHRHLAEAIPRNTITWRKYDKEKSVTRWRPAATNQYVNELNQATFWKTFIEGLLENAEESVMPEKLIIEKGATFNARTNLRNILESAKTAISIVDNFASYIEILKILEPYFRENNQLDIKVLTGKTNEDFKSDLATFIKQYGVIGYKRSAKDTSHDRYIIIDGTSVYHSGASFKDLGKASSYISKMDKPEASIIIKNFDEWWSKGEAII